MEHMNTKQSAANFASVLRTKLKPLAPRVNVVVSSLGGEASVLVSVSLDKPEDWPNGIMENSRYSRFYIFDGRLEQFSRSHKTRTKLRAGKVKSAVHAAERIAKWISDESE